MELNSGALVRSVTSHSSTASSLKSIRTSHEALSSPQAAARASVTSMEVASWL